MRRVLAGLVVFSLCLALANVAQAQFPGMDGAWGKFMLLNSKDVRTEIKLTEEQGKKADALRDKMTNIFQDFGPGGDFQEIRKKMEEVQKEMEKYMKETLKEEQSKRLDQIAFQQRGPRVFRDSKLREELKLTDEQKKKFDSLATDYRNAQRELFPMGGGFPDFQEMQKKTQELNRTYIEKHVEVLNADQKKIWKEKAGEPFKGTIDLFGGLMPRP